MDIFLIDMNSKTIQMETHLKWRGPVDAKIKFAVSVMEFLFGGVDEIQLHSSIGSRNIKSSEKHSEFLGWSQLGCY